MAFEHLKAKLSLDASEFRSEVKNAQDDLGGLASRSQRVGKKMQRAGAMMTAGITAPLVAMGAMAVRSAGTFDEAMANSMSVMGDVSAAMEEDLRDTAREVATSTEHSHKQAASALYFLSSAGLTAAESMEALPAAANFASAGQMNLEEATSILTTTMRAYGFAADETTEVTDTLAKTVASHNTTMEQMSTAMSQVGPVAASLGVGLDETAAAIGAVSDAGVQGERAGTALRNVMAQLSDEGSTASTQLREMGVATRDSQGNILPLVEVLRNMEQAGIDAGDAASVFGMEAGPAMAALMSEGSGALEKHTQNIRDSEGAAANMARTQRDTLNKELAETRSRLNDAAIVMGTQLVPYVSILAGHVSTAADRFSNLSGTQQKLIIAGAGVIGVVGPMLFLFGTMLAMLPAMTAGATMAAGAFGTLWSALLGPIGLVIAAVAALGLAWATNWGDIQGKTTAAVNWIGDKFAWLIDMATTFIPTLRLVRDAWKSNLFGVQDLVGSIFGWIGNKIDWLIEKIDTIPGIDFSDEDVDVPIEESADAGTQAGSKYKEAYEQAAVPEAEALTPSGSSDGEITGVITDQLLAEFSKDEIQDIFHARNVEEGLTLHGLDDDSITEASKQATITPEMLGISSQEFNTLLNGGRRTSGTSTGPPAGMASSAPGGGARSQGLSVEDLENAFRKAMEAVLATARLQMDLDVDDRDLEQFIDDRAEVVFRDIAGGR